jgi:hypothetical protein
MAQWLGLLIDIIDGWAEADRHPDRHCSIETRRGGMATLPGRPGALSRRRPGCVSRRVRSALDNMLADGEPDAQVAVFTHGLLTNIVLSRILSLERIVTSSPAMARSRA